MRADLQKKLIDRWPTWFNLGGDTRHTMMPLGFEHGDGWFDLLWQLCESLETFVVAAEQETGCPFEVLQVKEKFGGLRFHTNYSNDAISTVIEAAKVESFATCDICGQPGKPRDGSWIQTVCDEHGRAHGGEVTEP